MNNDNKIRALLLAACSIPMAILSAPAAAHHSAAMFDETKCQAVTGTVRNLQWQYPHSWLWLVVPNSSGDNDIWGFEMPEPSSLMRAPGWSREVLAKGEKVTVRFAPLRDGRQAGLANAITISNGTVLHAAPNAFACEAEVWKPGPSGTPQDAVPK